MNEASSGGLLGLLSTNPPAQFSYLGIFLLYLCSSPGRRELGLTILAGIGLRVATAYLYPPQPFPYPLQELAQTGGFVGLASAAALAFRARKSLEALEMLGRAAIFIVLGIALGGILDLATRMCPLKFDHYLYALDRTYGAPAAFVVGRWFAASNILYRFEALIYYSLPLAAAALYAAHLRWRPNGGSVDILRLLYVNAVVGFCMYFVCPASGPVYAFGQAFPWQAPAALALTPVALNHPPNCVPSLHLADGLFIWWNFRGWRRARPVAFVYLVLTALATLGSGEHYLIDLFTAFPYALLMQAIATRGPGKRFSLLAGAVMTFGWMALLRWHVTVLIGSPRLLWALTAVSVAAALWCERRLWRRGVAKAPDARIEAKQTWVVTSPAREAVG
ncbi:MAG TPA: phosphatase PAP2 family protein [Bryobacteraceae bacterium]|nr:phosphatase PAP2 family protein [Bryobacteraceae bacterium]